MVYWGNLVYLIEVGESSEDIIGELELDKYGIKY